MTACLLILLYFFIYPSAFYRCVFLPPKTWLHFLLPWKNPARWWIGFRSGGGVLKPAKKKEPVRHQQTSSTERRGMTEEKSSVAGVALNTGFKRRVVWCIFRLLADVWRMDFCCGIFTHTLHRDSSGLGDFLCVVAADVEGFCQV